MSRTEWCGDDGRITLLTLGFGVVLVALIAVIVAASSIHLERKRLFVLADSAAVRAADALDEAMYYADDDSLDGGPLRQRSVREAVAEHLTQSQLASRFVGLRIAEPTGTEDSRTAVVTLRATARPALVPWMLVPWSGGFEIRATSRGRSE